MNSNAETPSPSELVYKTDISCPAKDCLKVLPSTSTLKFHLRYYHKVDDDDVMLKSLTKSNHARKTKPGSNSEDTRSGTTQYFCPVADCKHSATASDLKPFRTIWNLKQHYTVVHAEKKHKCKACGKPFVSKNQKEAHETLCKVRFVCSCGIGYYGKRGILSHIKRSNHTLPEGIRQLLSQKPKKGRQPKSVPVKARKTPMPILPKSTGPFKYPIVLHNGINMNNTMTVICPPNTCSSSNAPNTKKVNIRVLRPKSVILQSPAVVNASSDHKLNESEIEMPSVSAQASQSQSTGNVSCSTQSHHADISTSTHCSSGVQANVPQMPTNNYMVAQDCSCQTDDFLAWLENTSHVPESSQTDIFQDPAPIDNSTQTQCNSLDDLLQDFNTNNSVHPSTAQIETQTEDWLYNFLHDSQFSGDGVTQTNLQMFHNEAPNTKPGGTMNDNNNNNTAATIFPTSQSCFSGDHNSQGDLQNSMFFLNGTEETCNIQTQTSVIDFGNDVTTQTKYHPQYADAAMSTRVFDFLSHTHTQTDHPSIDVLNQSSAQTQTTSGFNDELLSELLNMETQTDSL